MGEQELENLRRAVARLMDAQKEALDAANRGLGSGGANLDDDTGLFEPGEHLEEALVDVLDILDGASEDVREILGDAAQEREEGFRRLRPAQGPQPGPAAAGHDHRVQRFTAWLGTPRTRTCYRPSAPRGSLPVGMVRREGFAQAAGTASGIRIPASAARASALSVRSQGRSRSIRPKWPYAAVWR